MLRSAHARAILLLVALLQCLGCQSIQTPIAKWANLEPVQEERLATELKATGWHVNRQWTPLLEADNPVDPQTGHIYRWSSPHLQKVLSTAERWAPKAKGPPFEARKPPFAAGSFPIGPQGKPPDYAYEAVSDVLNQLASHSDATRWNAIVMLAQHDPATSSYNADLEWLVTQKESTAQAAANSLQQLIPNFKKPAEKDKKPRVVPAISLRAAAADAWCRVLARDAMPDTDDQALENALAPAGTALLEVELPAEVRRQLWRSIARYLRPDRIPMLPEALVADEFSDRPLNAADNAKKKVVPPRSGRLEDRRAAAEACVIFAVCHPQLVSESQTATKPASSTSLPENAPEPVAYWPEQFWNLRRDRDPQVRKSFALALTAFKHPEAIPTLVEQLRDQDQHVRESAAFCLGWLGTPAAMTALESQLHKEDDSLRLWAVRGLGRYGEDLLRTSERDPQPKGSDTSETALRPAYLSLAKFARAHAPHVRQEVARQFALHHNTESTVALKELVIDKNLEVQGVVVSGIEHWPDFAADPILLDALSQSALRTRQSAFTQLQKRKGLDVYFPINADATTRAAEAQRLAKLWHVPDPLVQNIQELAVRTSPRAIAQKRAEIRDRLAALPVSGVWNEDPQLVTWFQSLPPDDLPILEDLLSAVHPDQARFLREVVLPHLDRAHAALRDLMDADVNVRRRGGRQISLLGAQKSLSPLVMRTLHQVLQAEQDRLVWRSIMQAVSPDASDDAAALAELAINSSWPDIRVLGCEYVGRQARPQHAAWLVPLFSDESKSVQIAAVTAAGHCRNPIAVEGGRIGNHPAPLPGLRHLLHTTQGELHFRTIVSMTCLGDQEASQELIRLTFDPTPSIRLDVVQVMGRSGQTRFIEPLIRLAWTERHPNVRQAAVTSLEQLVPAEEHPAQLQSRQPRNLEQTIEFWSRWWEDRRASETLGERAASRPVTRR